MILLTVGSQLPFDRLVRAVDDWCETAGRCDVVAQVGNLEGNSYRPRNFEWRPFIAPSAFATLMDGADLIIAHAGMGSIISALRRAKPIVVMPRKASLGEHRNEHQQATAARFADYRGIYVAADETVLAPALERAAQPESAGTAALSPYANPQLILSLRRYILTGEVSLDTGAGDDEIAVPIA